MFGDYSYDVGNLVQLVRGGKAYTVKWRGYIKIPNAYGIAGRISVYYLVTGTGTTTMRMSCTALGAGSNKKAPAARTTGASESGTFARPLLLADVLDWKTRGEDSKKVSSSKLSY